LDSVVKQCELPQELRLGLSLLNLSPNPIAILQDGAYLDCNDAMLSLYGLKSKEEIRGQAIGGKFSPEQQPDRQNSDTAIRAYVDHCMEHGEASFSWVSKRLDGQLIHSNIDFRRLVLKNFSVIVLFYRDVSAHIATRQELQESENRFHALAINAPVGIYIADEDANCLFANPKMRELAGVTDDSFLGKGWLQQIHPEDQGKVIESWELLASGKGSFGLSFRFVPDGVREVWVSSNALAIERVASGPARYIGTATDITDIMRFEQQLENSRDEAERANQAKTVFLSHMSHELRTPLNAVLGFGQLLQLNSSDLTLEQREAVEHILGGGNHLLGLIEDILDLSRIESGKLELAIRPVDAQELIHRTIALVSPMAQKHGIQIRPPGESVPGVIADPHRLQQVLVNLLTNAIKYNRREGWVAIRGEEVAGGELRIHIVDNGRGIHPQLRSDLFNPFGRIRLGNEGVEGSGIGLGLSQLLMNRMGGRIDFDSDYGKGSDFWIVLKKAGTETMTNPRQ